ncbi:STM4012 family radical SAM protein [Lignipirellula cremea]|uniref:Oxygen-independent coproporphyrinogen-III oxidase 1 n=1 Tax=Lignipirellula cremea TaxID=2528010 RepID=A0A518DP73_9BACT|nr:STM4012 family radical SAM protein [Lignipirellula cremea]QDU93613.1 Oxygen-independent coproporphyrinogen-III oxidase 1 [Lignipirellula cremea]
MLATPPLSLDTLLAGSPFRSYCYSYPHKTAYRKFAPLPLSQVWSEEDLSALFLYLHIPFCEYRCGFCNLFTLSQPEQGLTTRYLDALERQVETTVAALPQARFAQTAIGGGTPTFLTTPELERLFGLLCGPLGVRQGETPLGIEASPATINDEKLALLQEQGVERFSMGIQSFSTADVHAMGRPQRAEEAFAALELVGRYNFPVVNLDLIYGGAGQTHDAWRESVRLAIDYRPQELFLYPLYVRPLTGLGKRGVPTDKEWDAWRITAYRQAREQLLQAGYEQVSLRMFRLPAPPGEVHRVSQTHDKTYDETNDSPTVYRCQEDGMLGLGSGSRSYTRGLHYSREYAVGSRAIRNILGDFLQSTADDFAQVDYGFPLNDDEQRRRYLILSLLQAAGLATGDYQQRFGVPVEADFPELHALADHGLAVCTADHWRLTAAGLEWSDAIGPWFYSAAVARQMEDYPWR